MKNFLCGLSLLLFFLVQTGSAADPPPPVTREAVAAALKKAASYYRERVALRGGYVYYYSADLQQRWGEGVASATQIWVQPPGTPTVGEAYLNAYEATQDPYFLDAADDTAEALLGGQLQSGGWPNKIDFDPASKECGLFRSGLGNPKGKNNSTLDDNATQAALSFLMRYDTLHKFEQKQVHEATSFALKSLLEAQYPNGGFPQVWSGPVDRKITLRANYPDYDWRTENRIKEYWNLYTLNDGLCGDVARILIQAEAYGGQFRESLLKLGDFLILAQMPEPQPAWAQQYNFEMQPAWARKFEPAAISGRESEDAIETLMTIAVHTGNEKYLKPIPAALAYLKKSELSDGRLARFYELKTNQPLYMTRNYDLTYEDNDLPTHYGFKTKSGVARLEKKYDVIKAGKLSTVAVPGAARKMPNANAAEVAKILATLDDQGRWLTTDNGENLAGQPKFKAGQQYLASEVFCRNLNKLSQWLIQQPAQQEKGGERQKPVKK